MREEIASLVHPVFNYGLRLKERLERGESPDLANEQAVLKGMLQTETQARRYVDFGSEGGDPHESRLAGDTGRRPDQFMGIRYALVCWLDEIFILDSPWEAEWNEKKLEEGLYGSNDRAWKFWEQARKAEARAGTDALEVFFLCVMLGFRGDLRDAPEKLQGWVNVTGTRIAKGQSQEWPVPPEQEPPINVPPLHSRDRLRTMVVVGGILLAVLIPITSFLMIYFLSQ